MKDNEIRDTVRTRYGEMARTTRSGCGGGKPGGYDAESFSMMSDLYTPLQGYEPDADLGLGCGLPTRYADLQPGETVVDLGSGAGNDAFVALAEVGSGGRVIGIDMTPEMVERARGLAARRSAPNVEFFLGEIEATPLKDGTADCVISNCVFNLVPDKSRAFAETYRILKPGGRFSISDIVIEGDLPADLQRSAEMYVGCVAGAMQRREYLEIISAAGFTAIHVAAEKEITIPLEVLTTVLSDEDVTRFLQSGARILSVTVNARRST